MVIILYSVSSTQRNNDLLPIGTGVGITVGGLIAYKAIKAIIIGLAGTPLAGAASLAF
jgi:hypothetical protein